MATISYERRRAAWSQIAETIITSSTRVRSMNSANPSRTVAGEPTTEHASLADTSVFSGGVQ